MQVKATSEKAKGILEALVAYAPVEFVEVPDETKPVPPAPKPQPKPDIFVMPKIDDTSRDSPNVSKRDGKIDMVILHNLAGKYGPSIEWLCNPESQVSAHLVISREGKTACLCDFSARAWHAGSRAVNDRSIGIEIEAYDGATGMTPIQEQVVIRWVKWFMQRYGIKKDMVKGHRQVCESTDCPILLFETDHDLEEWKQKNL